MTDEKVDIPTVVNDAIQAIGRKLKSDGVKGTIGDLLRLLELREELGLEPKGMVLAGWVSEYPKHLRGR